MPEITSHPKQIRAFRKVLASLSDKEVAIVKMALEIAIDTQMDADDEVREEFHIEEMEQILRHALEAWQVEG